MSFRLGQEGGSGYNFSWKIWGSVLVKKSEIHQIIDERAVLISQLRKDLHRHPELSGKEAETAARIKSFLRPFNPDQIISELGGNSLVAVYEGDEPGPTVLFRAELDALPIQENNAFQYCSATPGTSHMCGHDGHAATLAGLAPLLAFRRPRRGRAMLLFQAAEETGMGAAALVEDPEFNALQPDYAFALHNLPGYPMGRIYIKPGPFSCASKGMIIKLQGKTSHAAHPEDGLSPAPAMCRIIEGLPCLGTPDRLGSAFGLVTVVHARLGEIAYGISPGDAIVLATLRTGSDKTMNILTREAVELVREQVAQSGLTFQIQWRNAFIANQNDPEATERIVEAARILGLPTHFMDRPHRWSEDFAHISRRCKGAMLTLGAGEETPRLHNPDYDFPESLTPSGIRLFWELINRLLNE